MIITTSGTLIRTSMDGISTMGRYAQGVKLINIREDDAVATLCRADKNEEDESEEVEGLEGLEGQEGLDGQDTVEESGDIDQPEILTEDEDTDLE